VFLKVVLDWQFIAESNHIDQAVSVEMNDSDNGFFVHHNRIKAG
jgi:hypothetical protein